MTLSIASVPALHCYAECRLLSVTFFSYAECRYAECNYAECRAARTFATKVGQRPFKIVFVNLAFLFLAWPVWQRPAT